MSLRILEPGVRTPLAWTRDTLAEDAGMFELPRAALDELDALVLDLRANPLPLLALDVSDFPLPATRAFMSAIRSELVQGVGFALVDRLPVGHWTREEATAVYWLLASLIARPVAQKWDGTMVYDVRDRGKAPGNGVRPDITNVGQNYHTDNSYNLAPPEVVCLLCLQTAREGGLSGVVSFHAAHEEMRRRHPDLLERLYRPFYFDRQREHAPGDVMTTFHPMLASDGNTLVARLSHRQVVNGYELAGVAMDARGREALDAFEAILEDRHLCRSFRFEPGQMQFLNNLAMGHRRTGFTDWPEPERKRHLIRLWLRDMGARAYNG
jgi:alpha-ketoglutarate-dependent taurine dioxygenase